MESGGTFPRTSAEVDPLLDAHGLQLVSGWHSGTGLNADLEAEKTRVAGQLRVRRKLGAPFLVYGETAGTTQNGR